jgi:transposase
MAKGFRPVDRDQQFLLPPDMRQWLAADHLVWFVVDVVGQLDLAAFTARRALGGAGRAAYHPQMMVGLLTYAYAVGQRSSRQIERLCHTDVAFRIACAQDVPDHATIARFRGEHEQALGDLFEQVLLICARAGMGRVGTVALDGTKIAGNAAMSANRGESRLRQIAAEVLTESAQVDAVEDELFGDRRGDELPPELADRQGRAARIKQMLDDIAAERAAKAADTAQVRAAEQRVRDRRESLERARQRVQRANQKRAEQDAQAAAEGRRIGGTRPVQVEEHCTVRDAARRLDAAQRALARHLQPDPLLAGSGREAKRNLTDPDSRIMPTRHGWVQGYNAQIVVSSDYLILAAQVNQQQGDVASYQPMITATEQAARAIRRATGRRTRIGTVLADAGYASNANLTAPGPDRLIALGTRRDHHKAVAAEPATGDAPANASPRERMNHRLRTPVGAARYRRRAATVEPVNAHLKDRRGLRRFARRGLPAANSELRFAATVTNLLRLNTHLASPA